MNEEELLECMNELQDTNKMLEDRLHKEILHFSMVLKWAEEFAAIHNLSGQWMHFKKIKTREWMNNNQN